MITSFQLLSIILIFGITIIGGYYPLFRHANARMRGGFPLGQAFAAGVFLALALVMMLPNSIEIFAKIYPKLVFPIPALLAVMSFLILLAMAHLAHRRELPNNIGMAVSPGVVPVILTVMIAGPSFLLGTALGISEGTAAIMILLAILAHKGTAAFALALAMVRSTLTRPSMFLLITAFACATPLGVLVGADIHAHLSGRTMLLVKGTILSLAAGVFVFMATLHEMEHSPLIVQCRKAKGFAAMLVGLGITALVALLTGLARS
jgi:zinc transporter ZupT